MKLLGQNETRGLYLFFYGAQNGGRNNDGSMVGVGEDDRSLA